MSLSSGKKIYLKKLHLLSKTAMMVLEFGIIFFIPFLIYINKQKKKTAHRNVFWSLRAVKLCVSSLIKLKIPNFQSFYNFTLRNLKNMIKKNHAEFFSQLSHSKEVDKWSDFQGEKFIFVFSTLIFSLFSVRLNRFSKLHIYIALIA